MEDLATRPGVGVPGRSVRAAWLTGVLGVVLWLVVVVTAAAERPDQDDQQPFYLWALLTFALTTTSTVVLRVGLNRCADVTRVHPVPMTRVGRVVFSTLTLMALATAVYVWSDAPGSTWRGAALTYWAFFGGSAVLAALEAIRLAAGRGSSTASLPVRVEHYLHLRDIHQRALPPLGALVALATFALGAARQLSPAEGADPLPASLVIVFGLIGTTLVALAYQIPRPALAREARALIRLLAPIDQPDVGSVRAAIEDRRKVEVHLGLTTTLLGDLHAGTLILGPLLAGAIAVFVTGSGS